MFLVAVSSGFNTDSPSPESFGKKVLMGGYGDFISIQSNMSSGRAQGFNAIQKVMGAAATNRLGSILDPNMSSPIVR